MKKFFNKINFEQIFFLTSLAALLASLCMEQLFDPAWIAGGAAYMMLSAQIYRALAREMLEGLDKTRLMFLVVVKLTTLGIFFFVLTQLKERQLMGVFASIIALTLSTAIYAALPPKE